MLELKIFNKKKTEFAFSSLSSCKEVIQAPKERAAAYKPKQEASG